MKYFEIVLKLGFLANAVYLFMIKDVTSLWFYLILFVSLTLGLVLIFNKDSSYNYKQTNKDYSMRRIEGGTLVAFSIIIAVVNLLML